jgi:hypothetical protein
LLASIPEDVTDDCRPLDRDEPIQGELAALVCRTPEVEVLYELFPTQDDMNAAFQQSVNSRQAPHGDCATDTTAVSRYTIGGDRAGRVLCYTAEQVGGFGTPAVTPHQSHIEWTDENVSIYAHAVRKDLADLSLYQWWLSSSGPVPAGDGVTVEKDLPAALPAGLRDGTYMISVTKQDEKQAGHGGFIPSPLGFGTVTVDIRDGTYTMGVNGAFPETGEVLFQKPNSVAFAPERAPCGVGVGLTPVSYEWTAKGDTITWERVHGKGCAGPQPFTGIPWTRAPEGVVVLSQGGAIRQTNAAGFGAGEVVGLDTTSNQFPDWSPDGSMIVFAGLDQQGQDLYTVNADGSARTRLTETPGDERMPSWSPNGASIAFAFDDGGDVHWRSGIALTNPSGSEWTELVARHDQFVVGPVWSPDGTRIAFTVVEGSPPNAPNAYVMNADGSDIVPLSDGLAGVLCWTPDGRRILLSSDGDLVMVRPDGSDRRVFLGQAPEAALLSADYSPDGRWLIMASVFGSPDPNYNVYLMRANDGELFLVGSGSAPSWRPDVP